MIRTSIVQKIVSDSELTFEDDDSRWADNLNYVRMVIGFKRCNGPNFDPKSF